MKGMSSKVLGGGLLGELRREGVLTLASEIEREVVLVSSGISELDRVGGGGLPRGGITEVVTAAGGGATVLYAALAAAVSRAELSALIDPADGFDTGSAVAAGVDCRRLLWVRPQGAKQTLRAAELLLDAGGFGLVLLDLGTAGSAAYLETSRLPAASWVRLRKRAAQSQTVVLLVTPAAVAGAFAALTLSVGVDSARWQGPTAPQRWLAGVELSFQLRRRRRHG